MFKCNQNRALRVDICVFKLLEQQKTSAINPHEDMNESASSPIQPKLMQNRIHPSCLQNGTLLKPLIVKQKIGLKLQSMVALSQEMGSVSLEKCQSNCLTNPLCDNFTYSILKGYCLFLESEVPFTNIFSRDFVSSSKECIEHQIHLRSNLKKTAIRLENGDQRDIGSTKSVLNQSGSVCAEVIYRAVRII